MIVPRKSSRSLARKAPGPAVRVDRLYSEILWNMKAFYLTYPILDAVRRELSWTHYRLLLRVEESDARQFYEAECAAAHWSTRELEREIQQERRAIEQHQRFREEGRP